MLTQRPRPQHRPELVPHASTHRFGVPLERLWDAVNDVRRFPAWWSWLRDFETNGDELRPGLIMRAQVVPPVPYTMQVTVEIERATPMQLIRADVRGDLVGPACLGLREAADGSEITVRWEVEMRRPAMRAAARVARPMLVWGKDRVVAATIRRFREELERS